MIIYEDSWRHIYQYHFLGTKIFVEDSSWKTKSTFWTFFGSQICTKNGTMLETSRSELDSWIKDDQK